MTVFSKHLVFWFLLTLISILGFGLVIYSTVWGSGLISDSFQYVASARSLAAGKILGYPDADGNITPLSQYPPFFSVILAGFEFLGIDGFAAARFLNAALFVANIWLVGVCILRVSRSIGFSLFGALLTAVSEVLLEAHAWVMSEPLYIFLSLLTFLWLTKYFEVSKQCWLLASALAGSLALLTRYVGLALFPAAWIVIVSKPYAARKRKWMDLAWYSLIGLLPMIIWSLRNYLNSGQINNRSLQWVPLTTKNVYSLLNTIFTWFVPENLVNGRERWAVPLLIVLLILGGFAKYFVRQNSSFEQRGMAGFHHPLFSLHALYIPLYIIMVIMSKMLLDNKIGMTDRMFSPTLLSLIIIGSILFSRLWLIDRNLLRILLLAAAFYLVIYSLTISAPVINKYHQQGIGLARYTWQTSPVIQSLINYNSLPIYSNSPSTLYFWTGRTGGSILALENLINSGSMDKAVLVIFYHIPPNNRVNRLESRLTLLDSDPLVKIFLYEP